MKKLLTICAFLSSFATMASTYELNCTASHDMNIVIDTNVTVRDGDRNKEFGEYETFKFYVTTTEPNKIEIQSLNLNGPSRSYATSKLIEKGSFVELSIWTRDYLIDVRCSLL